MRGSRKTRTVRRKAGARARPPRALDPVTLAVLGKRFDSITTKMANTLLRPGRSGVLTLAKDFSTSIVTRDCELLTGAEILPIHVLSGADLMARSMIDLHPVLRRGGGRTPHLHPYHRGVHPPHYPPL